MRAADIMTTNVFTIDSLATVADAIYESQVRPNVEADNYGKIVAIDSDDRVERYQ
jgi:CBS domain-containing protein